MGLGCKDNKVIIINNIWLETCPACLVRATKKSFLKTYVANVSSLISEHIRRQNPISSTVNDGQN